jgi:ubiquinone/menaquinone biosynthesis C-methylase UbiE
VACAAFDSLAEGYDRQFVASPVGARMRRAVWARCAARYAPGSKILEMNCGTGEDALWLAERGMSVLATDASSAMLKEAARKAAARESGRRVRFRQLAWEALDELPEGEFDGVLSNFGGLNCVADLEVAARALAGKVRPGGHALLCIMGPRVPWEWAWYLGHGLPGKAFRRLRARGSAWRGMTIRYPGIGKVRRAFAPAFEMLEVRAIGALLPPPYADSFFARHERLLEWLDRLERRFESRWPLPHLADHYLLELVRT